MTSIAFIVGLFPLVRATGPGADSMYAVGLPVLAGMLTASSIGIFLIPMLYVVFQRMREGVMPWRDEAAQPEALPQPQSSGTH
jgi:Cu/Ag efflux pump CusA